MDRMIELELEKIDLYLQIVSELLICVRLRIREHTMQVQQQQTLNDEERNQRRLHKETSW
jgi:hypothetical protein